MIDITAIGCLHGHYPKLEGGDLLIITGDLTARDIENEVALFDYWLNEQPYKKKVVIAGNHDNVLAENRIKLQFCDYLCDSGTEYQDLKIWGSPWTKSFEGQNPKAMAFCLDTDEELEEKWKLIPNDTDILITHGPPYGILDRTVRGESVGCPHLLTRSCTINPKIHVFSHIHEAYGQLKPININIPHFINCSHVDERYRPVNKPVRVEL